MAAAVKCEVCELGRYLHCTIYRRNGIERETLIWRLGTRSGVLLQGSRLIVFHMDYGVRRASEGFIPEDCNDTSSIQ